VQRALAGLGFAEPDLATAVARFQLQTSLVADGRLGPRTRMAVFALSAEERPRLSRGAEHP
jgi:murein L,D-transpeptidase YcbB/YkuD